MWRYGTIFAAASLVASAAWRAFVALQHYQLSLTDIDGSAREFMQVNAVMEVGTSVILLLHGIALIILSRHPVQIKWPYALAVALASATILSGSLIAVPLLVTPGVSPASFVMLGAYPAAVIASVAILSHLMRFGWLSLYLGALVGNAIVWGAVGMFLGDLFMGGFFKSLSVYFYFVTPGIILAFAGAGLRLLFVRLRKHKVSA